MDINCLILNEIQSFSPRLKTIYFLTIGTFGARVRSFGV